MAELDLWLHDLVRTGLGRVQAQPYGFWDQMAARMVDAQAPAVAATIRRLPGLVRRGGDWPEELLAQLARLHLLASGWAHLSDLTEMQRADLRTAVGWPWPSDQVLAGAREKDRWYVLARSETEEERVTAIRTWLWGLEHGRLALVLDFARPGAAPAWELWPGNVVDAEVARFPGQAALRVLVAERHRDPQHGATPPAWPDLTAVASARSEVVAADPWTDRWPVSVTGVVPSRRGGAWELSDRDGKTLPMSVDDARGWKLLACSGGGGVHLLGEWIGRRVAPLGVWSDGRMVIL